MCGFDSSWTSISWEKKFSKVFIDANLKVTYHFEGIKFLLDLLRKHRREPVASSNFSTTIIVRSRPSVVELQSWAEADASSGPVRGGRQTLSAHVGWQARQTVEVIAIAELYCRIVGRSAWSTGMR